MAIGEQHIVKSFDIQLDRLNEALARMAGLAESQLAGAIEALGERDSDLAQRVIEDDRKVDACETFVNEQVVRLLTLRAPVADDLRIVVAALKAAGAIERIGDYAANAAKRALVLNQTPAVPPLRTLVRLGRLVLEHLKEAMDAYLRHDAALALAVRRNDQQVDELYSSLFREILTYMMEDPATITPCSHLLFIAKNIERVGDLATNIAEMTCFKVTGHPPDDPRPKKDLSAFVGHEGMEAD